MIQLKFLPYELIGEDIEIVKQGLKSLGAKYRVTRIDGKPLVGTADYNPARYNLHVEDNIVVSCSMG